MAPPPQFDTQTHLPMYQMPIYGQAHPQQHQNSGVQFVPQQQYY